MTISSTARTLMLRMRSRSYRDPVRDWLILVTLAFFALVGIVGWNAWAFNTIAGGGIIGASATSTPALVNRSSIDSIRTIFETRAAEEEKYVTGVYRYTDPSQ